MVEMDIRCQRIIETPLKQDQFNFLFETIKIVYESALVDWLIIQKPERKVDVKATMLANGKNPDEMVDEEGNPIPLDQIEQEVNEDPEVEEEEGVPKFKVVYEEIKLDEN